MLSSFLPEQSAIAQRLTVQDLFHADLVMYELDLRGGAVLEKGHVYLVPLVEELALPRTLGGKTNSKSTTGRLDVFTRTITDFHARFDEIRAGYRCTLYLELVPRSFSVSVVPGMCLNQLRLCSVTPSVGNADVRRQDYPDLIDYRD